MTSPLPRPTCPKSLTSPTHSLGNIAVAVCAGKSLIYKTSSALWPPSRCAKVPQGLMSPTSTDPHYGPHYAALTQGLLRYDPISPPSSPSEKSDLSEKSDKSDPPPCQHSGSCMRGQMPYLQKTSSALWPPTSCRPALRTSCFLRRYHYRIVITGFGAGNRVGWKTK